jgi:hypothetical protein
VDKGALFVAVGHHGLRMVSEDGADWKNQQIGKEGEVYRSLCNGNGRWVAVGSYGGANLFAASRDGKAWETSSRDAKYAFYLRGVVFGNSMFLAVGGDPGAVGDGKPFEMHSTDGGKWTEAFSIAGKNILRRVAFGKGLFVGVGDRGRRAISPDGRTWKDAPGFKAIDTLIDVAFGKDVFVGVGLHGLRETTADGLKWTHRQVGEEGEHINSVVWTGDRFVAVGQGATFTSGDGVNWKREKNQDAPLIVTHGKGLFLGASWKGRILRSSDAVSWRQVHKAEQHIEAIAFGTGS